MSVKSATVTVVPSSPSPAGLLTIASVVVKYQALSEFVKVVFLEVAVPISFKPKPCASLSVFSISQSIATTSPADNAALPVEVISSGKVL